jgi:hypothetical protein
MSERELMVITLIAGVVLVGGWSAFLYFWFNR